MLTKAEFTATFTVIQYSMKGSDLVVREGYGRMVGPDPGQLLLTTGHPKDKCPCNKNYRTAFHSIFSF